MRSTSKRFKSPAVTANTHSKLNTIASFYLLAYTLSLHDDGVIVYGSTFSVGSNTALRIIAYIGTTP